MRILRATIILTTLFALLLAGCSAEFGTTVDTAGAGQWSMSMGFTAAEMESLRGLYEADEEVCQQLWSEENSSSEIPPGATVREEQRGEETWCILEASFSNLDELGEIYAGMDIEVNRLEIVDGHFYYDLSMGSTSSSENSAFPVEARWHLTVPGSVGANNADSVQGRTLTWELESNAINILTAESSLGNYDWLLWVGGGLACLCLLVVVIGGGVGLIVYLRRKKA